MMLTRNGMLAGVAGLMLGLAPGFAGAGYVTTVVMSGLNNPRGLAFDKDGSLYVAEAGVGGSGPSITSGDGQTVSYGASGAVSRLRNGVQERVLEGLPSLAPAGGGGATGLHDIAFNGNGELFGVIGLGANPDLRQNLGAAGANFGRLVGLPLNGGPVTPVADLAAYESAVNPDGGARDTNPFGLAITPDGGFVVADAGANAILGVNAQGQVRTLATLPARPNPASPPPTYQSVPTGITLGPDGAAYFGELTGFPFPPDARIYRLDLATGELRVVGRGFTNLIDMAFGPDGALYALQLTANGLGPNPGPGVLNRLDLQTGLSTVLAVDGLTTPTSIAFGPDSSIYVTDRGLAPGQGRVLRLSAVPEPATVALLGLGLGLAGVVARARRRR